LLGGTEEMIFLVLGLELRRKKLQQKFGLIRTHPEDDSSVQS
jgi:hypothetical protein